MSNCTMCGVSIPTGQSVCSMCYGDIDYGGDGLYRQWAEEQSEQQIMKEQAAAEAEKGREL